MPKSVLSLLALCIALSACDVEREPINRVQPNYVNKEELSGTWYFGKTVIDAPYGAGYSFVGEQSPLYKITWDIQERYLIARRSYAHVTGAEPEGIGGASEVGNAIAMYRIERHFDIAHDYNPVTGEQMNVLTENGYDRPWFDRSYMRVDWSTNMVSDNELLIFGRVFHGIRFEPISYFISEQTEAGTPHPHAPKFERREDTDALYYMDIVNKVFVQPTTTYFEGFGNVPDCYLAYNSTQDCASADLTVRNSFLKVNPDHDYEPKAYTGDHMRRAGYFVTDRPGHHEQYGPLDSERVRLINRYNIWQSSHLKDPDSGEFIRCTANDAADTCTQTGSLCDVEWARIREERTDAGQLHGICTLPYSEREVKAVAYHLSPQFPIELEETAQAVVSQWNDSFAQTVASLRRIECESDAESSDSCTDAMSFAPKQDVLVLCHNPVLSDDPEACGSEGIQAQLGDLRYSMLGWVNEPNSFSPLGYGPSMADPQSGELINGTALIYGTALEHVSAHTRDILALLQGEVTEVDVMTGNHLNAWREALQGGAAERTAYTHHIQTDGHDAARINDAMNFDWHPAHQRSLASQTEERPKNLRSFLEQSEQSLQQLSRSGVFGHAGQSSRLTHLRDTDIEAMMTGPEMRIAAGVPVHGTLSEPVLDAASPLRGLSPQSLRAGSDSVTLIQKHACVLNADFADTGLLGLAQAITQAHQAGESEFLWDGQAYPIINASGELDYDQIRRMLRHIVLQSVAAHEIGHTLGLRHNFSGSFDSLNYHPEYWRLRDDRDMHPRAWDPMTQAELDGRIREYQYSTVMDYGNNFVASDTHGLGHYDHAAIKLGYGDLVEVFDGAPDPATINLIHAFLRGDWPVAITLESFADDAEVTAFQYTDLPGILGGIEGLEKRTDVPFSSLEADPFLLENAGVTDRIQDAQGRATVPYRFCSDEEIGLRPECQQFDAGADVYESMQSVIDTYWNHHIFDAFRRGRVGFQTEWHAEKVSERYFSKLKNANQIYVIFRAVLTDIFGPEAVKNLWARPDGMGAWTASVGAAFQLFTQVVSTPEPGTYELTERADGTEAMTLFNLLPETVDHFQGRSLESTWDFEAGYYWFDQLYSVGFYYDKVAALQFMTDPEGYFLGRDTATDVREYQINYHTTFGPTLQSFVRGVLAEDWHTVGPRLSEDGTLIYPDPLNLLERDLEGPPLDPNASFSIQLFASAYAMSNTLATYDATFFNSARIFADGGAESLEFNGDTELISFTHPESGITYSAPSHLSEDGLETGIGAAVLNHAQALADHGSIQELDQYMDNIHLIRRLSWLLEMGQ